MSKNSPSRHLFWQTTASIITGVLTGLIIISLAHKRPAQALVKSTFPAVSFTADAAGSWAGIQILPMLSQRMTVLIMGVDSNGRDAQRFVNTRSDTMILVSMDPLAHKVGIISVPRDSRVKIAGNHGLDKINAAHAFGGPQLALQTIAENFSVNIDHYVVVDTQALKELCQLLGPVELLVEKEMHYHDWAAHLHIDLKPGLQVLNPEQVEQYVRFRHDTKGDIGRIERQQWFFRAASKKMKDPQFLLRLPDLIRMAHDYVQTDLSIEDMARIATFAKDIKPEDVLTAMLPGNAEMINGGSYWVPDMDASHVVLNRILGLTNGGQLVEGSSSLVDVNQEANNQGLQADAGTKENVLQNNMSYTSSSPTYIDSNSNTNATNTKPIIVALKYCKSSEVAARQLESVLTQAGYKVRYMWLNPESECQHEQIIQNSGRADDTTTQQLQTAAADLHFWPIALQLDLHPIADFTIVVAPSTTLSVGASGASRKPGSSE